MKIIEALKKIKNLDRKIEKNKERISKWCSFIDIDLVEKGGTPEPTYGPEDIRRMMQQNYDWFWEKARIRHRLHKTNLVTKAFFDGAEYNIDQLLCLQNIVLPQEIAQWKSLRRKEKSGGYGRRDELTAGRVVLQYNPRERDMHIEKVEDTAARLDELLDKLNLETDLVEE